MILTRLAKYIKLIVLQEIKIREADITGDVKVTWGSDKHIIDLELRIEALAKWRDKQRRGSESRANYSRLIAKLKSELSSAKRQAAKSVVKSDQT
jgi:hypothetical protein